MAWRNDAHFTKLRLGNEEEEGPYEITKEAFEANFTVGAEAANVINVAIQLKDAQGKDLDHAAALPWYLADDAAGLNPATVAHSSSPAIGTDGGLIATLADLAGIVVSEADGDIDIDFTETGALTKYLVLVMPNGRLVVSPAITHAA